MYKSRAKVDQQANLILSKIRDENEVNYYCAFEYVLVNGNRYFRFTESGLNEFSFVSLFINSTPSLLIFITTIVDERNTNVTPIS